VARLTFALVYHDVVDANRRDEAGYPGPVAGQYKLDCAQFCAHLDAIAAAGVRCGLRVDGASAMLTFDDGGASSPWIAQELERRGWLGTFFIVTSRIGTPGFMDAEEVRELAGRGHEIGSHSHTHPSYMARLTYAVLLEEWQTSRELLAGVLGTPPRSAAVPGGSVSDSVAMAAAGAGYEVLFTSTPRALARRRADVTVLGRNTIWARDRPELAAALARGDRAPRAGRWLSWQAKSAAKRIGPRAYEAIRSAAAKNDAKRSV
jgi:peptidoglycan/xylan/chitin deacetylase (PgdA/CDA1 family)